MSRHTLANIYKKGGVKKRSVFPLCVSQYMHIKEYEISKVVSSRRIASLIVQKANFCYFDESQYNQKWGTQRRKLWSPTGHPIFGLSLSQKTIKDFKINVQVYLAIGKGLIGGKVDHIADK